MTLSPTPARRMLAGAALAGGLACGAVVLTACGSATPAASTGNDSSATPTTSPTGTMASPSSPAGPASTAPVTSTPASPAVSGQSSGSGCLSHYLRVTVGASQGTAGSVYHSLVFTNLANYTCTLYGYPGVSLTSNSPVHQVGPAANENPGTPRETVTLKPGGTAYATLQVVEAGNYPASKCGPVQTSLVQVYPPNQRGALFAPLSATACAKVRLLTIGAVRPGSGG